ncbi:MAG: hypothetical protein IJF07_07675 [Lachnospiraceae bacterium]|nr:hypothetical protein [Lachnospiraceae bacterium]
MMSYRIAYGMSEIISLIIVGTLVLLPIVLIVMDLLFFIRKKEKPVFELIAFITGGVYMIMGYTIWDLPEYDVALNILGTENAHAPFSEEHLGAIILFACWGFCSYFILKCKRKSLPPLIEVFLLAGIYVGMGLCMAGMLQLLCGARPLPADGSVWPVLGEGMHEIHLDSFDYFVIFCLCIVPLLFVVHCSQLLMVLTKEKADRQKSREYKNRMLNMLNHWLLKGANLFWVAGIAMAPVLGILVMLLVLFGQQPDSIILAFTKTSDWILSGEISPPPVTHDSHYLCTVSLRGHKRLVKPIRFGLRRGEKIVVNRQLCVANAFEQLLEEKTPGFHRAVRDFYDKYGYPVSRHIKNAWVADVVYVIMKPLEWFFLLVLYLCDTAPETRICSQYLPQKTKNK